MLDRSITLQIQHFSNNDTPIIDHHDADTSLFHLTTCSAEIAKTTIRLYEDSNKITSYTVLQTQGQDQDTYDRRSNGSWLKRN